MKNIIIRKKLDLKNSLFNKNSIGNKINESIVWSEVYPALLSVVQRIPKKYKRYNPIKSTRGKSK